jgi:hypothetical protein
MSPVNDTVTQFERSARAVLAESVARVDARTRSRLNRARHAALEAAAARPRNPLRSFMLMPAAGALAAAVLVAVMVLHRQPAFSEPPVLDGQRSSVEDMDLLADGDALDLLDGWDGPFYEWAVAQNDGNGESG